MPTESPYRIAVAGVLLLTMSVGAHYRRRAAASGERISRKEEGYVFAAVLRLAGLGVLGSMLAYLLAPTSVEWASLPIPAGVWWAGVVAGGGGPLLLYWTLSSLGKNLTDTVVTRAQATLVTHGPYR